MYGPERLEADEEVFYCTFTAQPFVVTTRVGPVSIPKLKSADNPMKRDD